MFRSPGRLIFWAPPHWAMTVVLGPHGKLGRQTLLPYFSAAGHDPPFPPSRNMAYVASCSCDHPGLAIMVSLGSIGACTWRSCVLYDRMARRGERRLVHLSEHCCQRSRAQSWRQHACRGLFIHILVRTIRQRQREERTRPGTVQLNNDRGMPHGVDKRSPSTWVA